MSSCFRFMESRYLAIVTVTLSIGLSGAFQAGAGVNYVDLSPHYGQRERREAREGEGGEVNHVDRLPTTVYCVTAYKFLHTHRLVVAVLLEWNCNLLHSLLEPHCQFVWLIFQYSLRTATNMLRMES